jgi:hypothetical protein
MTVAPLNLGDQERRHQYTDQSSLTLMCHERYWGDHMWTRESVDTPPQVVSEASEVKAKRWQSESDWILREPFHTGRKQDHQDRLARTEEEIFT